MTSVKNSKKYDHDIKKKNEIDDENLEKKNSDDIVIEEKEDDASSKLEETKSINTSNGRRKIYLSFETRIVLMIMFIILLLGFTGIFVYKGLNYNHSELAIYNEESYANYVVCLNQNDFYTDSCLAEDMQYISLITDKIPVTFQYSANYDRDISYDYSYYVVGRIQIHDPDDDTKILYQNEEILTEKKQVAGTGPTVNFLVNLDVAYQKYNEYVKNYKARYSLSSEAKLDVILYLEENGQGKKMSTVSIPLSEQTYSITKETIKNENQGVTIKESKWNFVNFLYFGLAAICILLIIIVIIRMLKLIYKLFGKANKYQSRLNQILREYDRVIVVSKGKYNAQDNKEVIKVDTFEELLDARDTLEKPIIYIKINNVKSEFYVEDDNRLYRYIMKEADFDK